MSFRAGASRKRLQIGNLAHGPQPRALASGLLFSSPEAFP